MQPEAQLHFVMALTELGVLVFVVGVQRPQSAGVCWRAAQSFRGPTAGYSKGVFLGEDVQELKSLVMWGLPHY